MTFTRFHLSVAAFLAGLLLADLINPHVNQSIMVLFIVGLWVVLLAARVVVYRRKKSVKLEK